LKSILKGASEDTDEPRTLEAIQDHPIPRTNPVNLIFTLSQYAPKVTELHFMPPRDFFDLVMKPTISSQSRAQAFLWLMWWYLQSDFSEDAALNNPFGAGRRAPNDTLSNRIPDLEEMTEEHAAEENRDPPDEISFGEEKQQERKRILENDEPENKILKRVRKSAQGDESLSDVDRASLPRAGSPATRDSLGFAIVTSIHGSDPATSRLGGQADSLEDDWEPVNPHPGRGRYKRIRKDRDSATGPHPLTSSSGRILMKTSKAQSQGLYDPDTLDSLQAQPPGAAHPILHQYNHGVDGAAASEHAPGSTPAAAPATGSRRPRPLTQHQLAVEATRRQLIENLLVTKKQEIFAQLREKRERSDFIVRAAERIKNLPEGYDSEDENTSWGMGGLGPNPADDEDDDFGEEAEMWMNVVAKVKRRLDRWSGESALAARKRKTNRKSAVGRWADQEQDNDVSMDDVERTGQGIASTPACADTSRPRAPRLSVDGDLDEIDKSLLAERSDEEMDGEDDGAEGLY
jgi:Ino eighty subunit 1